MIMKQKRPVIEVNIEVNDVAESKRVEKGLFSDRIYDEISVYIKIFYNPGTPTFRAEEEQKEQIGYRYLWDVTIDKDDLPCDETRKKMITPKRPVFKVHKNEYKLLLNPNDDFEVCAKSLARILVESQGRTDLYDKDKVKISPHLKLNYKSSKLENRLKRL